MKTSDRICNEIVHSAVRELLDDREMTGVDCDRSSMFPPSCEAVMLILTVMVLLDVTGDGAVWCRDSGDREGVGNELGLTPGLNNFFPLCTGSSYSKNAVGVAFWGVFLRVVACVRKGKVVRVFPGACIRLEIPSRTVPFPNLVIKIIK